MGVAAWVIGQVHFWRPGAACREIEGDTSITSSTVITSIATITTSTTIASITSMAKMTGRNLPARCHVMLCYVIVLHSIVQCVIV